MSIPTIQNHPVVSQEEWIKARQEHLAREKELTRAHDRLLVERRALPWTKVDKPYVFEDSRGLVSLAELFEDRSQLVIYHFMFAPDWEAGCDGCSFICDHVDAARQHFEHNDLSFAAVSRASIEKLEAYKKRMGWTFKWVSSQDSDFSYDFGASFRKEDLEAGDVFFNYTVQRLRGQDQPGMSVFFKDENGDIFHTYSSYERGGDILIGAHNWLDLSPKGRNETEVMDWMRRHDEYGKESR